MEVGVRVRQGAESGLMSPAPDVSEERPPLTKRSRG